MGAPKITRISIRNLRKIETLDLDLVDPRGRPVNQFVLAGPNGSGKTTVLEAILFGVLQDQFITRDSVHNRWPRGFPEGAVVEIELDSHGARPVWQRRSPLGLTPPGSARLVGSPVVLAIEYFSSWRSPHLVGPLQPLGKGNRPPDTEANRLWRLKQRLIDERSRGGFGTTSEPPKDTAWLERINRAWTKLHGHDGTELDVQIVDDKSDDLFADVFVLDGNKRRICTIDQLSSGEIELVSAAGWLVLSGMTDGILLIDEPELHLHPQWQATFVPALREIAPDLQIIMSTHADAPWDQAQPWERALLVPPTDPRSKEWREAHTPQGDA